MITRRSISLALTLILLLGIQAAVLSADEASFEQRGTYLSRQWVEAFKKLNTRSNITMVLTNRDAYYEVDHVISIEASGYFLIVKTEPTANVYYYALVFPDTIMLVKESPKAPQQKKIEDKN
jgi:hypothetical protein